jgi:hypothetical protein
VAQGLLGSRQLGEVLTLAITEISLPVPSTDLLSCQGVDERDDGVEGSRAMDEKLVWKALVLAIFVLGIVLAIWLIGHQLSSAMYG